MAFVQRPSLVARCREAVDRSQVVVVRGPAGAGKSHLVREVLDGLAAPPTVLDGFEDPVQQESRAEQVLAESPETRLVLVTRSIAPAPARHLSAPAIDEIEVDPLSVAEAAELLEPAGIADDLVRRLHAWADGLPYALTVAVDHLQADPAWVPEAAADPLEVARRLRRRLLPATLPELHYEALCATALSRRITVEALSDVVPDADVREVLTWLMERGLVDSGGSGFAIARPILRRVILADLRSSDTWLEQSLRTRLASRAHSSAAAGRTWLAADLVELIESPTIRVAWGTGDAGVRTRPALPEDAAAIGATMKRSGRGAWWDTASAFFESAPERVTIAIDVNDELLGYCVAVTPNNAPRLAHDDPILGPRLAHARSELGSTSVVIFRDSILLSDVAGRGVRGAMHLASIMRSDASNPRYLYLAVGTDQADRFGPFLTAIAADELPDLRVALGGRDMGCFLVDLGPRGVLDASRVQILNELGQGPSPFDGRALRADSSQLREQLERAVRNYHRPDLLAVSPLVTGGTADERVARIRAAIVAAVDATFGESDRERRLRDALNRAYFDPAHNHDRAALDMHVSRTTYFRLVRTALARTVDRLVESDAFGLSAPPPGP